MRNFFCMLMVVGLASGCASGAQRSAKAGKGDGYTVKALGAIFPITAADLPGAHGRGNFFKLIGHAKDPVIFQHSHWHRGARSARS